MAKTPMYIGITTIKQPEVELFFLFFWACPQASYLACGRVLRGSPDGSVLRHLPRTSAATTPAHAPAPAQLIDNQIIKNKKLNLALQQ